MTTPKIAIQARIWGLEQLNERYPAIFDEAVKCGYAGVETRATLLLEEAEGVRRYFTSKPLELVALHANLRNFDPRADDRLDLEVLLDKMNRLQVGYLLVSFGRQKEYGRWFDLAARVTETCAKNNVTFCYHNHAAEFEYAPFFDELTTDYGVALAADLAWVWKAGQDPVEFIGRHEKFIRYVHVKDTTAGGEWKELGNGEIDVRTVIDRLTSLNLPWWTVEQDFTDREPSESASISRAYLQNEFKL